nr:FAD-dependent monooxygenase [Advenella kashmirensis]
MYHPYTVYAPYHPGAGQDATAPVTIVGGGPIGLVTALILARHGIGSNVLISECQVTEAAGPLFLPNAQWKSWILPASQHAS